jgi:hypothetical protein
MNIQSSTKALQGELFCPVMLEPLSSAVTLVLCAHKVQQAAAEHIFGTTYRSWLVQSEKPCPVCRVFVLGYMTDHSTRNIVKNLFEAPTIDLDAILITIKNKLPKKSITVEKDFEVYLPFPGKAARFVHSDGDWESYNYGGAPLKKSLTFTSSTKNSLITKFSLLGYHGDKIKIAIDFNKNTDALKNYFKQSDLIFTDSELRNKSYRSKNPAQLYVFFTILAENNEIPASHFEKTRDIIAKNAI